MKIDKALVIWGNAADYVMLRTNLLSGCLPYTEPLDLSFRTARGTALTYLKANFPGVPVFDVGTRPEALGDVEATEGTQDLWVV